VRRAEGDPRSTPGAQVMLRAPGRRRGEPRDERPERYDHSGEVERQMRDGTRPAVDPTELLRHLDLLGGAPAAFA
jgi:hypothetical protein